MFIADLSYMGIGDSAHILLNQAKLAVLAGSVIAAFAGCVMLNRTLPQSIEN
jgi:Na+/H+ antiporter NhaA